MLFLLVASQYIFDLPDGDTVWHQEPWWCALAQQFLWFCNRDQERTEQDTQKCIVVLNCRSKPLKFLSDSLQRVVGSKGGLLEKHIALGQSLGILINSEQVLERCSQGQLKKKAARLEKPSCSQRSVSQMRGVG